MTESEQTTGDPKSYAIIGAAIEIHRELGSGFLEMVYHEAMTKEFVDRNIPFSREIELPIYYKGVALGCCYRADFICYGDYLVEIKAIKQLSNIERAQVINYLKATGFKFALLINFGGPKLEFERLFRP